MTRQVAIVGYSFRLPGSTRDGLWRDLCDAKDLVGTVDEARWAKDAYFHPRKSEPGSSYTFDTGTIGEVSEFDAGFFGISPREAAQMDPQQRILLELTWEAFEHAGIRPSSMRGSRSGVYLGISSIDYAYRRADDLASIDASTMTGNTASIAANRISYLFDLRGPSLTVDTACSSSLVAFHLACQSVASGDCLQAVTGGVSLHLHPFGFVGFSKASMLSPRGRCRVFDESGDGYVRSEGAGIFLLKDLEQARADGDRVFAIVAGSGINCDGKTNGLTVPGADAQAALLQEVYARAGIAPTELDYLEAHGTGTAVGDPIEASAIGQALGRLRPSDSPLLIGSVKSNLGHLESASGVAGLVKALHCLKHRAVPPSIHFERPNPNIPFDEWNLKVVTETTSLDRTKKLVVGVNSFGFGGANAHVVLTSGERSAGDARKRYEHHGPMILSARSEGALRSLSRRFADLLRDASPSAYYDIAYSAAFHRDLHPQRIVAFGPDRDGIADVLQAYASGDAPAGLCVGTALPQASRPAFVYSGNGSQWAGMGRQLLATNDAFRAAVAEVDSLFAKLGGFSILDELNSEQAAERLELTEIAQPTLFAIQVGITSLLRQWGITPSAVVGHSVGEVAAAWASGALSLEQAVRVIQVRSSQQGTTKGSGGMTAIGLGADAANKLLHATGMADRLALAGVNSPRGVTVAGDTASLDVLERLLAEREVFFRRLGLDYAFHSPAMDPIQDGIRTQLAGLRPRAARTPYYSTVTGTLLPGDRLNATYWWRNIREPVQFEQAIDRLLQRGVNVFVEIGPHAVLRNYISDCLRKHSVDGRLIPTMLRSDDRLERVQEAFYQALIAGAPIDLGKLFPKKGRFVDLPLYPWQREHYWHPLSEDGYNLINRGREHPLLGYRLRENERQWENHIDAVLFPALGDHVVGDTAVFPGSGFVEMALAASRAIHGDGPVEFEDLEILAPLLLEGEHSKTVRVSVEPTDGTCTIRSRNRLAGEAWLTNAVGRLIGHPALIADSARELLPNREPDLRRTDHYALTSSVGLNYGPNFQVVEDVWVEDRTATARLAAITGATGPGVDYLLHPAHLDGCFQLLVTILRKEIGSGDRPAFLPVRVGRLQLLQPGSPVAFGRASVVRRTPRSLVAEFTLFDAQGRRVANLSEVRFRAVGLADAATERPRHLRIHAVPRPFRDDNRGVGSLPPQDELLALARDRLHASARQQERRRYYGEVEPLLDVLCASYAERALRELTANDPLMSPAELAAEGRIAADSAALLLHLVQVLQEDGVIEPTEDGWRWSPESGLPQAEAVWISLLGDYPDYAQSVILAGRVGMHLAAVLAGNIDAATLIARDANPLTALVAGSTAHADFMLAIEDIVTAGVQRLPEGKRLRILELSSARSSMCPHLLSRIESDRFDYVIGSPSQADLDERRGLIDRHPGLEGCVLDLQHADYGWSAPVSDRFDIVIVTEGLTPYRDIGTTLSHLKRLLHDDGLLLTVDQHPSRSADLLCGLHPDWWVGQTRGAGRSRLRTPAAWRALLERHGFIQTAVVHDAPNIDAGAFLIAGRAPVDQTSHGEPASAPTGTWLLLQDDAGYSSALGASLRAELRANGHQVVQVRPHAVFTAVEDDNFLVDLQSAAQLRNLLTTVRETYGDLNGIVHLHGLPDPSRAEPAETLLARQERRCMSTLQVMTACEALGVLPTHWLVTGRGAMHLLPARARAGLGRHSALPADAAFWGFGRTLMNEYAEMSVRLVDCAEPSKLERMAAGLLKELINPDGEDEVILTGAGRYATRVATGIDGQSSGEPGPSDQRDTVRLDFTVPGPLKHLGWHRRPLRPIGSDEVEIAVCAAGLNFRDVMYAMGLLSDEAVENGFAGPTLGMELSGVVVATGSEVSDIAAGDEVIAFAPSSFGTRAITRAAAVVPKPSGWSHESAATVPIAFFTVYYALHHLARLREGERILIHGAAGAVGIAAIQLAKYFGAEIFATAGSDEKRDFVRMLGADFVMDSRSLSFADEILQITGGKGVDVVLNSLAGEAINRNLRILKPFGRFLELGKRDFYENTKIGLRPFRNNIAYFGIDADQLMTERPDTTRQLFLELMDLFAQGALKPLPYRAFAADAIVDAFRYMQQSKQIGKIVVTLDDCPETLASEPERRPAWRITGTGTYIVTGGLSGFGVAIARWLAQRGASHLVLLSRSGKPTAEARNAIAAIERFGVRVRVAACDVTDAGALRVLLSDVHTASAPVRGIVHAAATFDDVLARNMTAESLRAVLAPKVLGALHLHELTQDMPLDFMIFVSSATTLFGNPGQANYVAANHYLEALSESRRASGLPCLCIALGPIADVGYLARNQQIRENLESRLGGNSLSAAEALQALEHALTDDNSGSAVLKLDWRAVSRLIPTAGAPKFQALVQGSDEHGQDNSGFEELQRWLAEMSDEELAPLLINLLKKEVGEILKIPVDRLDEQKSVHDLGMDSLMGMELITAVESRFGVKLPIMALSEGPTIARLVDRIIRQLRTAKTGKAESSADDVRSVAAQYAHELGAEHVDELADMFAERLDKPADSLID
ncbi:MAG: type I polyketide synthase [Methylotetracoccus sp.]